MYKQLTRQDFDNALRIKGFNVVHLPGVSEVVYDFNLTRYEQRKYSDRAAYKPNKFAYIIRIYSSICKNTGVCRSKGKDAIRIALIRKTYGLTNPQVCIIAYAKSVNRTENAIKNTINRARSLAKLFRDHRLILHEYTKTNDPHHLQVKRRNKSSDPFWGSSAYPQDTTVYRINQSNQYQI